MSTVDSAGFPGEDRSFGGTGLYVDLIPSSSFGHNVRAMVTKTQWNAIRKIVIDRCGRRCECCGRICDKRIDVHERWHFDEPTRVQALVRLVGLCVACHEATHYGLAVVRGRDRFARRHLMRVNGWSEEKTDVHIHEAFEVHKARSQFAWMPDVAIVRNFF